MRRLRAAAVAVPAALTGLVLLTGCTGKSASAQSRTSAVSSATAAPTGLAGDGGEQSSASRSTIMTTPRPSLSTPNGVAEVPGTCPYISNQDFADLEGDRVGRVTILQSKPVGCRFYFQYNDTQVVGQIEVNVFKTSTEAYNAMVLSAKGHPEVQSDPNIGDGSVAYTAPLQGNEAWLCVFAKGKSVVTVRTQQPYPALNAQNIARQLAPEFK
jgi:hypothetical protein